MIRFAENCRKKLTCEGVKKMFHRYKTQLGAVARKFRVGRTSFHNICREAGLMQPRKKSYRRTTDSNHPFKKYPNLIDGLEFERPEQVWVVDITYIKVLDPGGIEHRDYYLSLITDQYSKRIMGYHLNKDLSKEGCLKALDMALKSRRYPERALIHHSDQGSQYCSYEYTGKLVSLGIKISMSGAGNPYQNAIAERVNGILKDEFKISGQVLTFEAISKLVEETVKLYNSYRLHTSNGYLTPDEMHAQQTVRPRRYGNRKSPNLVPASEEEAGSAEEQPASSKVLESTA